MAILDLQMHGRQSLQDEHVLNRYRFNDIFSAVWLSEALVACTRLGVPEALDGAPVAADRLAGKVGVKPELLYRLMRALAANGIFEELPERHFRHNPMSRQLRADHPYSYKPMVQLWGHPTVRRSWERLHQSLASGNSGIREATGRTLYDQLNQDAELAHVFNHAMISNSSHPSQALARSFALGEEGTVVELAGGIGTLLAAFLDVYPGWQGQLLELPYLAGAAGSYLSRFGERATFIAGDFTVEVPAGADLYLVKNTLWNFPDEVVGSVLRNVRRAMKPEAVFYLVEYVVEPDSACWSGVWDLQIFNLPGGRARTVEEYEGLLAEAGLRLRERRQVEDQTVLKSTA